MEKEPQLLLQPCECGDTNCRTVVIAMIHPVIVPVDGTNDLACKVHFPLEHAQSFVDTLRELAADRGINVE